jgi:hypothetical protein
MREKLFALAGSIMFLAVAASPPANAASLQDAMADYRAQLFAYFRSQPTPLLPIFVPSGEEPGDVYRDLFLGYAAHRADCFDDLHPRSSNSNVVGELQTSLRSGSAGLNVAVAGIAQAASDSHFRASSGMTIQYSAVKNLATTDVALRKAFHKSDRVCVEGVAPAMNPDPRSTRIPLILGTVFSGSQTVKFTVNTENGNAALGNGNTGIAEFISALKLFGLDARHDATQSGTETISATTDKVLPFGWLPAFISREDLQRLLDLEAKGTIGKLEADVAGHASRGALLDRYAGIIVPVSAILGQMTTGTPIPFNIEERPHREYISTLELLIAVAIQLFGIS